MAKSENQKLKLLKLKEIFEQHTDESHGLTMSEIINHLNSYGIKAERKSIYNDIEALRQFNVDIVTERTSNTVYSLASRTFELAELKILVDLIQSSKFLTVKKSNNLISKIQTLCSRHDAKKLQQQVFIFNRIKTQNETIYYNVDRINNAITSNQQIEFNYFEYTVLKERRLRKNGDAYIVSPFALMSDDENYYLLAYDAASLTFKHYRVDKILNITLLPDRRKGEKDFQNIDIAIYQNKVFSMFSGEEHYVKMQFNNHLIGVVIDRFGIDTTVIKSGDNHFTINVKVAISPQFFAWVFSFGGAVKILSPQSIVDEMKKQLENSTKMYN